MNTIDLCLPIDAPPELVLDAVDHPERLAGHVPGLEVVRPISASPSERNYEWCFELDGLPVRLVQHRDRDTGQQAIRTRRIAGDIAELVATWSVDDANGCTRLRVRMSYRIGLPFDCHIAGTFHRHMSRFVAGLLEGFKRQAESGETVP